jgi:hypothetical protein
MKSVSAVFFGVERVGLLPVQLKDFTMETSASDAHFFQCCRASGNTGLKNRQGRPWPCHRSLGSYGYSFGAASLTLYRQGGAGEVIAEANSKSLVELSGFIPDQHRCMLN